MTTETNNNSIQRVQAGTRTTEGFGSREIQRSGETQSAALASQARANVEARFIVARGSPRDLDDVRIRLLRECKRPGFANVARYSKPVGGKPVVGPSIRFVEAALRYYGNATTESAIVFEDAESRQIRVTVTDLETNTTYASDALVSKLVERKRLAQGQRSISQRVNSYGDTVFIVHATEDELLNKVAAIVSKTVRTLGLRMIPGDIVEECMQEVVATQNREDAADPNASRKRICDAFAGVGVMPSDIAAFLGHAIDSAAPDELRQLREAFAAIRDGETTWRALMDAKVEEREERERKTPADGKKPAADPLDKLGVKGREKPAAAPAQPVESPPSDPQPAQPAQAAADSQAQGIDAAAWIADRSMKRASSIAHDLVAELPSLSPADATALEDSVVAHLAKQPRVGGTDGALRLIDEARRQTS